MTKYYLQNIIWYLDKYSITQLEQILFKYYQLLFSDVVKGCKSRRNVIVALTAKLAKIKTNKFGKFAG